MSKSTASVPYRCLNNCRPEGCPGHVFEVTLNRYVDVVVTDQDVTNLRVDNKHYFDQHAWEAAVQAWCELTGQELVSRRDLDALNESVKALNSEVRELS